MIFSSRISKIERLQKLLSNENLKNPHIRIPYGETPIVE